MTVNSPLGLSRSLLATMTLHLLLRTFWTNWLRTAIAPGRRTGSAPPTLFWSRVPRARVRGRSPIEPLFRHPSRSRSPRPPVVLRQSLSSQGAASTASSTTTKPRSGDRRPNRMARKSAQSNLGGRSRKGSHSPNDATPSNSSATISESSTRPRPVPPGARARDRRSITAL
jgi:hypothetical protein